MEISGLFLKGKREKSHGKWLTDMVGEIKCIYGNLLRQKHISIAQVRKSLFLCNVIFMLSRKK